MSRTVSGLNGVHVPRKRKETVNHLLCKEKHVLNLFGILNNNKTNFQRFHIARGFQSQASAFYPSFA